MKYLYKYKYLFVLFLIAFPTTAYTQNVTDTLDVVNWNLENFGDTPSELPQEMDKTRTIMNKLNADIYALEEIVNTDSLISLVHSLNGDYDYIISQFGSFASSAADPDYASAQKLAFVYRRSMVRNITSRPLLAGSLNSAYYNWSSGRYPFFVTAEVMGSDSSWLVIHFVVVHAKAMSDASSCDRKYFGGKEMKDSLDTYYANERLIILGDYNDDLDQSICSNYMTSTYSYLVNDSLDDNSYKALTLPMSKDGIASINGYPSFIDHVIVSNEVFPWYVPYSAVMLKSRVTSWVSSYNNYVSDHFPVMTQYRFTQAAGIQPVASEKNYAVYPNPVSDQIHINLPQNYTASLYTMDGHCVRSNYHKDIPVYELAAGIYLLRIFPENSQPISERITILH